MLRCLNHPNIIQFYTSYTLDRTPYFMFAAADYTIKTLMSMTRPVAFSTDEAIVKALYGLSSGIAHVHNYFHEEYDLSMVGCHYDLKPDNVLVKKDQFILADFGLSRLKLEVEGSRSNFQGGASDYLAPECQNLGTDLAKNPIVRASDIWSFGCILRSTHKAYSLEGVAVSNQHRQGL